MTSEQIEDRYSLATTYDQYGSPLIVGLGPPNITLHGGHQGSSAIMDLAESSVQPASLPVCGMRRYPSTIAAPMV